jgi:hypothetical protein
MAKYPALVSEGRQTDTMNTQKNLLKNTGKKEHYLEVGTRRVVYMFSSIRGRSNK